MLIYYFKSAVRILKSQRFYSIINVAGLSIGITACILVMLYVKHDLSYDKYHMNARQIYRIEFSVTRPEGTSRMAQSPALLGPTLKSEYPEIKKFTRVCFTERSSVKAGGTNKYEDRIIYADSAFFGIFTFKAVAGNVNQFLKKPNSIILTESTAKKYFSNENPLGQIIEINNQYSFEVTGVIQDIPDNSHFKFDFIAPYSSLDKQPVSHYFPQWGATFGSYTYMLADKGFDPKAFEKKTENFFSTHTDVKEGGWRVLVRPLTEIHLKAHSDDEIEENSSLSRIVIISSIALFILLLACINFVNLSTARSSKRAMEIGIRKIIGAAKSQLVTQFLGESVMFSMAALLISIITVKLVLPSFSSLVGAEIVFDYKNNLTTIILILCGVLTIGIMAGLYPALFISSYQPVKVIKGINTSDNGKNLASYLRKGLVILQFSISIIMIAGTIIVNLQLRYLRNYNMGFDKEYMIVLPAHVKVSGNYQTIKNELKSIPGVISATAGRGSPTSINNIGTVCKPNGAGNSIGEFAIEVNSVDYDYMNHFGVKLIAGRYFSEDFPGDFPNSMVINEKMARSLGFKNAQDVLGKSYIISLNSFKPEVIGVVKDFNSSSLHNEITNQVFMTNPEWFKEFIVKVKSENIASTINSLKEAWVKFFPQYPFEYSFLDESIDLMYKSEDRYSKVISIFSVVALFIACLGLLGLASFVTEQRKKEIGIRKVQGASVNSIVQIVSGEFMILVLVANLIAWPTAYFLMNKWLTDFAFRIGISAWPFILAGGAAFAIALLTVCFHAIRVAVINPVKSIE
jgi:putative ABC transport system permease protein